MITNEKREYVGNNNHKNKQSENNEKEIIRK